MKLTNLTWVLACTIFVFISGPSGHSQESSLNKLSPSEISEIAVNEYLNGNHKKSVEVYNEIVDENCLDANLIASKAMSELAANKPENALENLNKALSLDPENPIAEMVRLRILFAKGSQEQVIDNKRDLKALLESYPNNAQVIVTEAMYKNALGDIFGAIASMDVAIEINPNSAYLYNLKGKYLMQTKGIGLAKNAFSKALHLNNEYADATRGLGIAYVKLGRNSEALELLNGFLKSKNDDVIALYNRGVVKNNLSDFEAAIEDFNRVLELDEVYIDAYFHRSHAFFNLRQYGSTIDDLDYYLQRNQMDPVGYSKRALAKLMNKDKEGACQDLHKADELGDLSAQGLLESLCN